MSTNVSEQIEDIKSTINWAIVPIPSAEKSRGISIADRYFLKGETDYPIWCIVMKSHLGTYASATALDSSICPTTEPGKSAFLAWDQFALNSIMLSIHTDFISLLDNITSSAGAWKALQNRLAPKDAQAALRVLKKFWPLQLTGTDIESLDKFELQYTSIVSEIKSLNLTMDTICSAHLLGALPTSLSALETTISVNNPKELPPVSDIFTLVRNELSRGSISNNNPIGFASISKKSKNKIKPDPNVTPPKPCRYCNGNHWNIFCPNRTKSGNPFASLATSNNFDKDWSSTVGWHASTNKFSLDFSIQAAILDSGATHHMTGHKNLFHSFTHSNPINVGGVGGSSISTGKGKIMINLNTGNKVEIIDVLFVEGLKTTLLSTNRLFETDNLTTVLGSNGLIYKDKRLVATATKQNNGLYKLDGDIILNNKVQSFYGIKSNFNSLDVWHKRFGHLNPNSIKLLINSDKLSGFDLELTPNSNIKNFNCSACLHGKGSRFSFSDKASNTSSYSFHRIHSDILTMPDPSLSGCRYAIIFVDDYTRKLWTRPLTSKSEAAKVIQEFITLIEKSHNKELVCFRSDNGGEFTSNALKEWFKSKGITHETTTPYTPQQNGVAERVNRTIVEGVLSMLRDSGLPNQLWAEAMLTFTHCKNLSPHSYLNGDIPERLWKEEPIHVDHLKAFGCRAWATKPGSLRKKLDGKAIPLIFIGYEIGRKAYRLLDLETKSVIISRDVKFIEDEFPARSLHQYNPVQRHGSDAHEELITVPNTVSTAIISSNQHSEPSAPAPETRYKSCQTLDSSTELPSTPTPLAHSTRPSQSLPTYDPRYHVIVTDSDDTDSSQSTNTTSSPDPIDLFAGISSFISAVDTTLPETPNGFSLPSSDPVNWKQALNDVDHIRWEEAAIEEFRSLLEDYNVFKIINHSELPSDAKLLGGRFVFRRKKDKQGKVKSFKARLVAQGFSQRPGLDFNETFAPVAKFVSIRTIIALAAKYNLILSQADVDKAYLHGELEEQLYMKVPEGIKDSNYTGKVLKLCKSIYGLKQAGRVWNHRIDSELLTLGYKPTESDHCVYFLKNSVGLNYIALYVDDLLFASSSKEEVKRVKNALDSIFGIKDLGNAEFILGIQILRTESRSLFLSQRSYLIDVLARFNMQDCKSTSTPMENRLQLKYSEIEAEPELKRKYMQAIGSLLYAALATRPDLSFAVNYLGRFSNRPTNAHWSAIQHVLRYIKGTLDIGILYHQDSNQLNGFSGYSDSDWGSDINTSRSTMGFIFKLSGGPVSWSSKVQPRVTESSTEAEYLALSHASHEAIYLQQLLGELGQGSFNPVTIFGDNQGALALAKNPVFGGRLRHLRLKEHAVREHIKRKEIKVAYIQTKEMIADIFTKALPKPQFEKHRINMGVCYFTGLSEEGC